ncbi:nuA3 HAT complex component nto1 [Physocladia obscura]|uniref:NuA3 HAT complex component nto1 n=1 Tax=Physocladia obscura TaxID=109957 RepID=A0AAD5XK97_9FUNG|nr:nuA3 HAT complex component nto1 [Physocladia obscura]
MTTRKQSRRRSLRTQTGLANFLTQDRLFEQQLETTLGLHEDNDSDGDSQSQSGEGQSNSNNNTRSQSYSDAESNSDLHSHSHSEEEGDNTERETLTARIEEAIKTMKTRTETNGAPMAPTIPETTASAISKRGKRGKWKRALKGRSKAARRRLRNRTRNNSDNEADSRESGFVGSRAPGNSCFNSPAFTGVRRLARRHIDALPLEERAFDSLAPGLKPDAQLRLLRLPLLPPSPPADPPGPSEQTPREQRNQIQIQRQQSLPEFSHSSSLSSLLRSGLDVLMSAISSSAVAAPSTAPVHSPIASPQSPKRKSPSPYRDTLEKNFPLSSYESIDSLESMFENDPPPPEFKTPTSLPPFNDIYFSKPIPVPRFELISAGHENTFGNSIAVNSLKKKGSFTSGFGSRTTVSLKKYLASDSDEEPGDGNCNTDDNGDDVGDGNEEEEIINGVSVEPSEEDLSKRIEYDMDEQDKIWLEAQNAHRFASINDSPIPPILFEFIMDRLEKEYFSLLKRVPKPRIQHHHRTTAVKNLNENSDDNVCAVCDDGECENSNTIVFCDGCNLAVHQDCYGIPYIPEGQWLCRRCMLTPETPISCVLCPAPPNTGALKQTNNGGSSKWAHIVCAQWIPEAGFANSTYMEPIDLRSVPNSRFKLTCYICGRKKGACIQCSMRNCFTAYHVTCAKRCKIFMKISGSVIGGDMESEDMKSYCEKHSPKEYRELVDVEKEIQQFRRSNNNSLLSDMEADEANSHNHDIRNSTTCSRRRQPISPSRKRSLSSYGNKNTASRKRNVIHRQSIETSGDDDDGNDNNNNNGMKEAQQRQQQRDDQYKKLVVTPVIPLGIYKAVCNSIRGGSSSMRGKNAFVEKCCKYWALKRESRRGAPLLKRLYLEQAQPWTATISETQQDETIKFKRMEFLRKLRNDLEKVRMLAELVKKRERERLRRSNMQCQIVNIYLNPVTLLLRPILDRVRKLDVKVLFEEPVDLEDVPDYLSVVGRAMCFEDMQSKLERNEYRSVETFQDDFLLICRNAKLYNGPDTPWYRAADRLLARSEPIFDEAFEQESLLAIEKTTGCLTSEIPASLFEITTTNSGEGGTSIVGAILSPEKPVAKNQQPISSFSQAYCDQSTSSPTTEKQRQLLKNEEFAKALHKQELPESLHTTHCRIATAISSVVTPQKESYNDSSSSVAVAVKKHRRSSTKPVAPNDLNCEQLIAEKNQNLKKEKVSLPLSYASVYLVQGVAGSSGSGEAQKKRRQSLRTVRPESAAELLKTQVIACGFKMLCEFKERQRDFELDVKEFKKK